MKQFIRDYLTFNKRERNGIFILLSIIFLLLLWLYIAPYFFAGETKEEHIDFTPFENEIEAFNLSVKRTNDSINQYRNQKHYTYKTVESKEKRNIERFEFNPNNLPENDWRRLGLSEKQISIIKNYENKGGKFHKKEDVKKMYCISDELYSSLQPYIVIPLEDKPIRDTSHYVKTEKSKKEDIIIELNSADSAQLTTIRGIGAFYAKTILKYRNLLGGFYNKQQLMEVWKFDSTKYAGVEKYITIDASQLKKININKCTDKELKHPYLTWNMVNAIVAYRKMHGMFKTIDDIKKTDLVDDITYRKIAPYLIVDF